MATAPSSRGDLLQSTFVRLGLLALVLAALAAPTAVASQIVSTSTQIQLGVDATGEAMVRYLSRGEQRHVLAWDAANASAPTRGKEQVALQRPYDSVDGSGRRRESSFLTHGPLGSWCYSVDPHGPYPAATGSRYRFTLLGPALTADVSTTLPTPGRYDTAAQQPDNDALRALGDPHCRPHRAPVDRFDPEG
ncbi:MAG TPA: hypothetical protein VHC45_08040 [Gaiellaceae bacterium]|nr:hypothetical protein [Gaiellaceae bacterium]